MTPIQFKIIMSALDELRNDAQAVKKRLVRVERLIATFTGAIILLAYLVETHLINVKGLT